MDKQHQSAQFYNQLYSGDGECPSLANYNEWHEPDINDSISCIAQFRQQMGNTIVMDLGAGDGRVVQHVFQGRFDIVDVLEPDKDACEKLRRYKIVRNTYQNTVDDFQFEHRYDCIWIQGVLGHVPDEKIVGMLHRAGCALCVGDKHGHMVVKEFVAKQQRIDEPTGSAVVRTVLRLEYLFKQAGLQIIDRTTVNGPVNQADFEQCVRWVLNKQ